MKICDNCFNDEEMQMAVRNESAGEGVCDVCGQTSAVVDLDFFSDFFSAVLQLFSPDNSGEDVVSLIQKDWGLFVENEVGRVIVRYFLSLQKYGYEIDDKVSYVKGVQDYVNGWERLKVDLMSVSRFATDISDFFDPRILSSNTEIRKDATLFRARVIPSNKKYLTKSEMGCPPSNITPAGRANPQGIPYLYLCQEEATTYYEVRAVYLDKLTIGTFAAARNLRILDFTNRLNLYYAYNNSNSSLMDEVSKQIILRLISEDLSKPLRRFDTELEYVPTQYICEYCKLNGVEGIRFNSSLHEGGVNVVLFDSTAANCKKVTTREIKHVTIGR